MAGESDSARIRRLNDKPARSGRYVLYWMQQSQRERFNHALEYAIGRANALGQPTVVLFVVVDDDPHVNLRQARFMLEGLAETQAALARRGVPMVVRRGEVLNVVDELAGDASMLVCDRGYLRHQRQARARLARRVKLATVQVESDAVVPVDVVSRKQEHAARTIRPKIHRQLQSFLVKLRQARVKRDGLGLALKGVAWDNIDALLGDMQLDRSAEPVDWLRGGTSHAHQRLTCFIENMLGRYTGERDKPHLQVVSHLSPYLHFGQISPVEVALRVSAAHHTLQADREAFLEQLIVRRELAFNFTEHSKAYDRYAGLPTWCRATLEEHRKDARPERYTLRQLEQARTGDPYWNAAMNEMRHRGYLHNHMRMYWGKMILNWSVSPQQAYRTALKLNNRYFIDGHDPTSFANVGWLFGLHDRPWPERPVFGKVRSMTRAGLERKIDAPAYLHTVHQQLDQ